ncbi:hypothetical protein SCUP234_12342 [Seiridium cupressi]
MDDSDTEAMAAAMGFSSFGMQPSAKRRKFNADDAVVASSSDAQQSSYQPHRGKGANATPLGARPVAGQNRDEISLDDEEDDADPEPQYIDTSRPVAPCDGPTPQDDAAVPATVDDMVGTTAPPSGHRHAGGRGGHHGQRQHGDRHRGDGRKPWWEDYYDPTTNMNPWEKLEKENGLKPLSNDWLTWEESKAAWEKVKPAAS